MKNTLLVYPTFMCNLACNFCEYREKTSYNQYLDLDKLNEFLINNHSKFDNVIITGGEPTNMDRIYFDKLVNILKLYFNDKISVWSYILSLDNYRSDVNWILSFDFMTRSQPGTAWGYLLEFPKQFDLKITLTPALMKTIQPIHIIKKLNLLPNINSVEMIPYYKNMNTFYGVTNETIEKYYQHWLMNKNQMRAINVNAEKLKTLHGYTTEKYEFSNEYCILPDGELYLHNFNQDIRAFEPITVDDIGIKIIEQPSSINLNDIQFLSWAVNNVN